MHECFTGRAAVESRGSGWDAVQRSKRFRVLGLGLSGGRYWLR